MIRILFSGDFPDITFVEVEDENGKSIRVGEWEKQGQYWVLKITDKNKENKRLREALEEMLETVYWMSGSSDFSPEGQAHEGWIKVQPKIKKANKTLEGGGE